MDKQLEVVEHKGKVTLRQKIGTGVAVATTYALANTAHAAGSLDAVGTAMTGEIDGGKAILITVFSAAAVVIGLMIGWRYLKRGGNSA